MSNILVYEHNYPKATHFIDAGKDVLHINLKVKE